MPSGVVMGARRPQVYRESPVKRALRERRQVGVDGSQVVVRAAPILAPGHLLGEAPAVRIDALTHGAQELLLGPDLDDAQVRTGRRPLGDVLGVKGRAVTGPAAGH